MQRRVSIGLVLFGVLVLVGSPSCSCSSETRQHQAQTNNAPPQARRVPLLPSKNVPRPALPRGGNQLRGSIDERFGGSVPAPALELLDAPHAVGPASHGKPAGARRAERLARLLEEVQDELALDHETLEAVSLILSRFDVHRHALRQSERRGTITRDDAQASLSVLVRERNFMLRDYLGRERARRIFQLERAQRAKTM